MDSRRAVCGCGDAISEDTHPLRCSAAFPRVDNLFAAVTWGTGIEQVMNGTTATLERQSSRASTLWKVTLIAIPIVTLGLLIWLRHMEVNALRQRSVSSYGSVPEFQLTNQD